MTGWTFDPPGELKEFKDPGRWHAVMADGARDIVAILTAATLGKDPDAVTPDEIAAARSELAYVDPTVDPPPPGAETLPISAWGAFPHAVAVRAPWAEFPTDDSDPDGRHRAVEHLGDEDHGDGVFVDGQGRMLDLPVRDRQDEYLEWSATRDSAGRITRLTFVAEGYDYFAALFAEDEVGTAKLFGDLTGLSNLTPDHLRARDGVYRCRLDGRRTEVVAPGGFNPRNAPNIHPGIVHLSHRANSLGAEVNLAGVSGIARRTGEGATIDGADPIRLLCCNQGGVPNRNSDPLISAQAYAQVLGGYRYTLANPVGLYVAGVETGGLLLPDNTTEVPREWWRVVRGSDLWSSGTSRALRVELEVPASEKLTISDLLVGGAPVAYPGQVADLLSIHLFVTRWKREAASIGPLVPCTGTCCRQTGGALYEPSNGTCQPGFEPAFPDLLPRRSLRDIAATSTQVAWSRAAR